MTVTTSTDIFVNRIATMAEAVQTFGKKKVSKPLNHIEDVLMT